MNRVAIKATRVVWDDVPADVKADLAARGAQKEGAAAIVDVLNPNGNTERWYFRRTLHGWNNLSVDRDAAAAEVAHDLTPQQRAAEEAKELELRERMRELLARAEEKKLEELAEVDPFDEELVPPTSMGSATPCPAGGFHRYLQQGSSQKYRCTCGAEVELAGGAVQPPGAARRRVSFAGLQGVAVNEEVVLDDGRAGGRVLGRVAEVRADGTVVVDVVGPLAPGGGAGAKTILTDAARQGGALRANRRSFDYRGNREVRFKLTHRRDDAGDLFPGRRRHRLPAVEITLELTLTSRLAYNDGWERAVGADVELLLGDDVVSYRVLATLHGHRYVHSPMTVELELAVRSCEVLP